MPMSQPASWLRPTAPTSRKTAPCGGYPAGAALNPSPYYRPNVSTNAWGSCLFLGKRHEVPACAHEPAGAFDGLGGVVAANGSGSDHASSSGDFAAAPPCALRSALRADAA